MKKWHLIESINTEIIGIFNTAEEAIEEYKRITDPTCLDPYYDNLVSLGGYLRIEDEDGNGI